MPVNALMWYFFRMAKFSAQVSQFSKKSQRAQNLIMRTATQDLIEISDDATPKDTGNLYRSGVASTSAMPPIREDYVDTDPNAGPNTSGANQATTEVVIMGLKAGDPLYYGYQAAYAQRLNYGFTGKDSLGRQYSQQGRHWVENSAAKWPEIVAAAEKKHGLK